MNKRFLQFMACALMMVCAVSTMQAQDYAYFTDFSNGIPDDIALYDQDGLVPAAQVNYVDAAWVAVNFTDIEGSPIAASTSWYDPVGTADDWMVLPAIDISLGQKLVWKAGTVDDDFADGYEIVVSTVSNDIADMEAGTVIYSVAEEEAMDFSSGTGSLYERELDLDEWADQTIYIGFRNNSNDKYLLVLDDIGVLNPPMGQDASIANIEIPIEYGWMPIFQASPVGPFEASVFSFSDADLSDARIVVHIDSVDADGNFVEVWTAESDQSDLTPLTTGVYEIEDTWMPEEPALYVLYYEVIHDDSASDQNSDNDFSEAYYFFITDLDYSRNANFMNGEPPLVSDFQAFFFTPDETDDQGNTIPDGEVATGEYGQVLEFNGYSAIDSVGIQIQDASGDIVVNVYEFDPSDNSIGELLGSTLPFSDGTNGENVYTMTYMETPLSLAPGHYFVSVVDPDNGSTKIIACNYYWTPNRCFFKEDGGDWEQFAWVPVIETYLTEVDGPATAASASFDPNSLTVDFTGMANGFVDSWAWDFGDGNTSSDQSPTHVYDMAGTYSVTLTVTLPDGTQIVEMVDVTVSCLLAVEVDDITPSGATAEFIETGAEPYTYIWQNTAGETVATTTEPTVDGLDIDTDYTLIVEDNDGCSAMAEFTTAGCNLSVETPLVEEQIVNFLGAGVILAGEPTVYNWPQAILDGNANNGTDDPFITDAPLDDYTMTIEDEFGCSVEVSFTVDEATGIEDIAIINEMEVYPNPANDVLMVKLELKEATDVQVGLYDIAGKLVVEKQLGTVSTLAQPLNVADLANGIYMVRVTLGADMVTYRVVIGK